MADSAASDHPQFGGKSIESVQAQQNALASRKPYKSWRKKYRKMRAKFDTILEENKRLFKEEQKLEGLARRLTEELDSLMEILLDLNQNSAVSPELRYDISLPYSRKLQQEMKQMLSRDIPSEVQPEQANEVMRETLNAVQSGRLPSMDMLVIRDQLQDSLAMHGVKGLSALEAKIQPSADEISNFKRDNDLPPTNPAFLSSEQESKYLARLDAKTGMQASLGRANDIPPIYHQADLSARELERQLELMNPQSQHNWLKSRSRAGPLSYADEDNTQDAASAAKSASRKRTSSKNLAKQIGDRAMDRVMREAYSPGSGIGDDDELGYDDGAFSRRRGADKDPTFRAKGGRGGSTKAKRKRTTDEGAGGGGKRLRASEIFD